MSGIKSSISTSVLTKKPSFVKFDSSSETAITDALTVQYKKDIAAIGGSISATTLSFVNEFALSIRAAGITNKIFDMGVFCGNNLSTSLVKLKYTNTPYMSGVSLVEADYVEQGSSGGIKGNGSSKYIVANTAGGTYASTNGHMSAYIKGTEANGTSRVYMGHETSAGGVASYLGWINAGAWDVGVIYGTVFPAQYTPQTQTQKLQGHICISASGSVSQSLYVNGVQLGASVNNGGSTAQIAPSVYLLCEFTTVPTSFSTRYISFYSIGSGLTATESLALSKAVGVLQGRLGRQ